MGYWNEQSIDRTNAISLTSGKSQGNTVDLNVVKRITYALQNIPDIIPTHLNNGSCGNGTKNDELANRGFFLGKGAYTDWLGDGGFDGRWVQLFQD